MKSVLKIGEKYGRLTIKEYAGKAKNGSTLVKCVCDCGTEKIVRLYSLKKGEIKSCGCLARELLEQRNKSEKQRNVLKKVMIGNKRRAKNEVNIVEYKA